MHQAPSAAVLRSTPGSARASLSGARPCAPVRPGTTRKGGE